MSTQITISPVIKLEVNTTPITGGSAGQILFQTTGNTVGESANLFWDNTNGRLGIGTSSPSAIIHSVGSVTASGAIGRGNYLNNTLVASANNDVLVGLDIQPTFTNGAFTGVTNYDLRFKADSLIAFGTNISISSNPSELRFSNGGNTIMKIRSNATLFDQPISFGSGVTPGQIRSLAATGLWITVNGSTLVSSSSYFFSTGNVAIGTNTDAGFKLDVNGPQRILGNLTITAGGSGTNTFNANTNYFSANRNEIYGIVDLQNPAGQSELLKVTASYSIGSGTASQYIFSLRPNYNFTGTYSGTVRGIYYNPTLTSMTGVTHFAFHSTSGRVRFEGLPTSSAGLSSGEIWNDGGILKIV